MNTPDVLVAKLRVVVLAPSNSQGLRDMGIAIANALHDAGVETTLAVNENCETTRARARVERPFSQVKYSLLNAIRLLAFISRRNYDAVHLMTPNLPMMLMLPVLARLKGFVLTFENHGIQSNWHRPVYHFARRHLWRRFDGMVLHSKADVELLRKVDPAAENYRVIPCGSYGYIMDARLKEIPGTYVASEQRVLIEREGFKILFFGYVRDTKRLDLLLEAVRELPITLIVAGDNRSRLTLNSGVLHEGLATVVVINRLIPEQHIHYFFANASAVVLPYDQISESGILHLAITAARPVIASDIPAFRERRVDQFGLLFAKGDKESLRSAILCMQDNYGEFLNRVQRHAAGVSIAGSWSDFGMKLRDYIVDLVPHRAGSATG
jgi:glycosyltransferase involved in cell wall biosynthesis